MTSREVVFVALLFLACATIAALAVALVGERHRARGLLATQPVEVCVSISADGQIVRVAEAR